MLGALEVRLHKQRINLGGAKPKAVLAALLVHPRLVVPLQSLIAAVWESPPRSAAALVHTHISSLRRALAPLAAAGESSLVLTSHPGYQLCVDRDDNDLEAFEELSTTAQVAEQAGDHDRARVHYERAVRLWRGAPLDGVEAPIARQYSTLLEGKRLTAEHGLARTQITLGCYDEAASRLTSLTAMYPLRDEPRALLMQALYFGGRRSEALAVYRDYRDHLVVELGVEPTGQLRELHERVLHGDLSPPRQPEVKLSARPEQPEPMLVAPNQLPPDLADFTGRAEQLTQVMRIVERASTGAAAPTVVITGFGGTGKSALAVHAAHVLRSTHPDGALFVDMRGNTAPTEVLARFLRALGVAGGDIPAAEDQRVELFRMRTSGRRLVIVLDNVRGEQQVRALLPGDSGCIVLITSRSRLTGLAGAEHVEVERFTAEQSMAMLAAIVGNDRITSAPPAAVEIVELCGGVPLAIRAAGAKLLARPHWPLRSLANRLANEQRRLDELSAGDLTIRSSLRVNYDELSEPQRRAYHLLALLDFPDFGAWVAAPLLRISLDDAEDVVERLVDLRFAEVAGADPLGRVRYRFHDLVQLYGAEQALLHEPPDRITEALGRLAGTWTGLVKAGELRLPLTPSGTAADVDERLTVEVAADPIGWLEAETAALVRTVERAAELGATRLTVELIAVLLASAFAARSAFDSPQRTLDVALNAARSSGDRKTEARLLTGLGQLYYQRDDFGPALDYAGQAAEKAQLISDHATAAVALVTVGTIQRDRGLFDVARRTLEAAAVAGEQAGDLGTLAASSYGIGAICRDTGDFTASSVALGRSAELHRQLDDPRGEAIALRGLSQLHRARGEFVEAFDLSVLAHAMLDRIGAPLGAAYALQSKVKAQIRLGRFEDALGTLDSCLAVCERYKDRFGVALVSRTQGEVMLASGDRPGARARLLVALTRWKELELPLWQARTLRDLAAVEPDPARGEALWTQARATFRSIGSREERELARLTPAAWFRHVTACSA
ncbi:hypothetical protein ALI144C_13190 [Actinosynnema sp. ALI-1.44]|nr:hypothetical protein ALI144C_13190 [Actinosynnema sp. ALI-1.44]